VRSTPNRRRRPFWSPRRRPGELQADVDEELRVHLEMRVDELVARGLSSEAARREALRQFGDFEYTRRYCRTQDERKEARMRWNLVIDQLIQDLRNGVRQCIRNPGFTAIVVATLALGIGANTALFSIFNSLSLRELPVRDPARLALLANGSWTYPIWEQIRTRETELFDGAFAWSNRQRFDLSTSGQTEVVDGAYVSGRFFAVLGVTAFRGRVLTPEDDGGAAGVNAGSDSSVAVISYRLWRQRFAGANDIVGRPLTVQRRPFTIVGVMPPGFFGADVGRVPDVMVPFAAEPLVAGPDSRLRSATTRWLQIMVRLRPGQNLGHASGTLRSLQPPIVQAWTKTPEPLTLVSAAHGISSLRSRFETPLVAMMAAVGIVLLVACGNLASLMLARTLARRRELSVRLALGSSRWRIVQLLFVESLIVAVIGSALGLVFAWWSSALLVQQLVTAQNAVSLDLRFDWRVLAFTGALACLSAILAGVAPVLGLKRVAAGEVRTHAARGITGDGRYAVRGMLVIFQIAMSFTLVAAAGLFLRTFSSLSALPLGFVPEPLLVMELNLQARGGPAEERPARVERLREAAAAVPGVHSASVSVADLLPGAQSGWASGQLAIGDQPIARIRPLLWLNATTPGWFETMGIPVRQGRDFEAGDRIGSAPVVIVNEAFVRQHLAGGQAIGQSLRLGFDPGTRYQIVGVVGDAVYTTPREGMMPTMYMSLAQRRPITLIDGRWAEAEFWPMVHLTVKATPETRAAVERAVASALTRTDPRIAFVPGTFDQVVAATVRQERFIALLSAFFGGLALLLAAVGLYGLVAHSVRARRTEIGLRMALGAVPSSIVRLVFQRVGVLIAAGLALGLAGSLWAARFVEALLFQLDSRDPVTFTGAAVVLVAVGVLAAWLPAHRAARIDPLAALRTE